MTYKVLCMTPMLPTHSYYHLEKMAPVFHRLIPFYPTLLL